MKLEKFNLPAEITHMISTLEPEHQGIVYCHLFAYIYDGIAVPDDIEPRCRLIITMILRMIGNDLRRARGTRSRRTYRPADRPADRNTKFWSKRPVYKYNCYPRLQIPEADKRVIIEASKQHPAARKRPVKLPDSTSNAAKQQKVALPDSSENLHRLATGTEDAPGSRVEVV